MAEAIDRLARRRASSVSLFLDPDPRQIDAAARLAADAVELHTGEYALAAPASSKRAELAKLRRGRRHVRALGLTLHAGHGLTYRNVKPVAAIDGMSRAEHRPQHRRPGHHGRLRAGRARDEEAGVVSDRQSASIASVARLIAAPAGTPL